MMRSPKTATRSALLLVPLLLGALAGCDRVAGASRHGLQFPDDAGVTAALAADFARDPGTSQARTLVTTLGGEKGALDYRIRDVVARGTTFEAHYDVLLKLAQPGTEGLAKLYGSMVPAAEKPQVPAQDLDAQERWIAGQVQALEKTDPAQAQALRQTVNAMGKCYRNAKAGDAVPLMEGLVATVLPSRNGWYAERVASPNVAVRCIPA